MTKCVKLDLNDIRKIIAEHFGVDDREVIITGGIKKIENSGFGTMWLSHDAMFINAEVIDKEENK